MILTPQGFFRLHGGRPRKRFGQHFLTQDGVARRIVASAELQETDVVVEVGPGLGALTQFIVQQVRQLHLVELDRDLAEYLMGAFPSGSCRVEVHCQDILNLDFAGLSQRTGQRMVLLGNLPYNISSPLLFRLLEQHRGLQRAVFMLQREVGERLTAPPGGKSYGVLSILVGVYASVAPLFLVGPRQFYPPPQVDSIVVRLDFLDQPLLDDDAFQFLRRVVNHAFQHRRKTLLNCLRSMAPHCSIPVAEALAITAIDPRRRPETLALDDFIRLSAVMRGSMATAPGVDQAEGGGHKA
jgi:16S rRNA (adenine1518-N6/adenine1519-N6)-dimethyltransferase